jgi:hypothetical protein
MWMVRELGKAWELAGSTMPDLAHADARISIKNLSSVGPARWLRKVRIPVHGMSARGGSSGGE